MRTTRGVVQPLTLMQVSDLMLYVQAETVERCCEIANKEALDRHVDGDRIYWNGWRMSAEKVTKEIRAAFPDHSK